MTTPLPIPEAGAGYIGKALLTLTRKPAGTMPAISQRFGGLLRAEHVSAYRSAMGFDQRREAVPMSYHYLAIQRAQVALMLRRDFPFPVVGMVHVANRMMQLGCYDLSADYELALRVEEEPCASDGRSKARFVCFAAEVLQAGQVRVQCHSRYLAKRAPRQTLAQGTRVAQETPAAILDWINLDSWQLETGEGLAYARLSGDYNPIHLWDWSARLLGFKKAIIQGMHSVGRVEAALERLLGREVLQLDATFRQPILIGSRPVLRIRGAKWVVTDAAKECITGQFA
ncbi:MAG: hypothetical protein ING75_12865 [Rhodocyclaceae bacterium]|nr:hypothetical protein [Rhodocyclaceae bacterium]